MNLYLVQHGEAMDAESNPDRPLTDRGRERVSAAARFLSHSGIRVPEIWHSGKTRARETAEVFAEHVSDWDCLSSRSGLGPKDPVGRIASALRKLETDVMIVGHLPHLDCLASMLLARDDRAGIVHFENGAVLCLSNEGGRHWQVQWYLPPSLIAGPMHHAHV